MKKFISILAIAVVSLNFVSCRQDDVTSDMEVNTTSQEKLVYNKGGVATTDSVKITSKRPVDPDPPVKDGTSW